jgi:hypothetical protein
VIGGAQIYEAFLPHIEKWIITEVPLTVQGADAFMPKGYLEGFQSRRFEVRSKTDLVVKFIRETRIRTTLPALHRPISRRLSHTQQPLESRDIRRGHHDLLEPKRLRFARAHRRLHRAAHFARQPNFTKHRRVRIDRHVLETRNDRRHHAQIHCRLVNFQTARDVYKHVIAQESASPRAFRASPSTAPLDSDPLPASCAGPFRTSFGNERLNLNQQRPRAFHARRDDRARHVLRPFLQKHLRRICHRHQSGAGHLKDTDFVRGAKTILHRAHDAMVVMTLAFKVENSVNDVLEAFGPAIDPSLVMWPIRKIGMVRFFASIRN